MKHGAPLVAAAVALCVGQPQVDARQDVTATVISQTIEVGQPPGPCEAAGVVALIARVMQVPAGVEHAPGACTPTPSRNATASARESLQGLSVREALDRIVEWDPRYQWQLLDGVVSFRPVTAIGRPDHFLHTSAGSLHLDNENVGGALVAIAAMLGAGARAALPSRTPLAEKRFSLSVTATSAVDALDAIVRAHGEMWWEMRYCRPEASPESATLYLYTFDKGGVGYRLYQTLRGRGATDPCRVSAPSGIG